MNIWLRRCLKGLAPIMVLALVLVVLPTHAHAASNGQQVYFIINHTSCGAVSNLGTVTITGQNQMGLTATWSGTSSDGQTVFTANWWWVGSIQITYSMLYNGQAATETTTAYVPQETTSDYPYSDAGYVLATWAGTRENYSTVLTSDGYDWACINSGNPVGHLTYYEHWYGYVYTTSAQGFSPDGYALANGQIVPYDVTDRFTTFECDG